MPDYDKANGEEKTESYKCPRKPAASSPTDADYHSPGLNIFAALEDKKPLQDPIGIHIQELEFKPNVIHVLTTKSQNSPSGHQVCLFYT